MGVNRRTYYLFEIEADGKPVYSLGEWENINNLTDNIQDAETNEVLAYGEVTEGKYLALYEK